VCKTEPFGLVKKKIVLKEGIFLPATLSAITNFCAHKVGAPPNL